MKRKWEESQSDGECIKQLIGKSSVMEPLIFYWTICFGELSLVFGWELGDNSLLFFIYFSEAKNWQVHECWKLYKNSWMILIQTCKHSIQQQDMFSLLLWTVSAVLPAIQISLLFFWWQQLIVSVLSLISFLTMFQVTTSGPSDIVHHSKLSPANFCLYN